MRLDIYLVKGGTSIVALVGLYDAETKSYVNDASVSAELVDPDDDTPFTGLGNLVLTRDAADPDGYYSAPAPHTATAALAVGQRVKGICLAIATDGSRMPFIGHGSVYESAPPPTRPRPR